MRQRQSERQKKRPRETKRQTAINAFKNRYPEQ